MATVLCFSTAPARVRTHQAAPLPFQFGSIKIPTAVTARIKKPVEELYNIRLERNVEEKRLEELGVKRWSRWESGKCKLKWEWHVDQLVYISKGCVRVVPRDCKDEAWFYEGDLVRYPKWLEAALYFQGPYEECYRFLAYGDDLSL